MILALDLAAQTGFAVGKHGSEPFFGTINLEGQRPGIRFLQLGREITGLIKQYGPTEIAIEEAYVGKKLTGKGLMTLFGYRAVALMVAENNGIKSTLTVPSKVRSHFLGNGLGGLRRDDAKRAIIHQCKVLGWKPNNDDEADALALWDFRCSHSSKTHQKLSLFTR